MLGSKFGHTEIQEKGFIRTVKTPKPPAEPTVEERLAALETENAVLKARLAKVEKQKNPA